MKNKHVKHTVISMIFRIITYVDSCPAVRQHFLQKSLIEDCRCLLR